MKPTYSSVHRGETRTETAMVRGVYGRCFVDLSVTTTRLILQLRFGTGVEPSPSPAPAPSVSYPTPAPQSDYCDDGFICHDGTCLASRWECDGLLDCPVGEDEHCGV